VTPTLFSIEQRDPDTQARTGTIALAHGTVRTPAFVPLATKGTVKTLLPQEVAALGFDMVLGNTYHLWLTPGEDVVAAHGGLHEFMGWSGPIITDSGGFQVFSMGHGTVADEVKGRASQGAEREGAVLGIDERGVRFRSHLDGSAKFMGPEESMAVQAALRSDIALAFDECTPFNVDREYVATSTERTHRWLDRCLGWRADHAPEGQVFYGIVQGGTFEDLRRESTAATAARAVDGIAIGGSLGDGKPQMYEVVGWATGELDRLGDQRPRHLLGIGDIDDLIRGVELGIDTFDCAMPTRIARHGMALVPDPDGRWRVDLAKARFRDDLAPVMEDCPCPCCTAGYSRAYIRHLFHQHEGTGLRLLTLHNLTFVSRVMADLRRGVAEGRLADVAAGLRGGAVPGALPT
jgi:queuine tRNA-ribosyltransferase